MKKPITLFVLVVMIFTLISCGKNENANDTSKEKSENTEKAAYENAMSLIEEEKYEEAYEILKDLGDYEDAQDQLSYLHYIPINYQAQLMEDNGWETIRSYNASVDTKNNNIKVSYYWDRSSSGTDEFIYDKNGNFTYMNKESQITNSTFNENNNLIKSVLTSPDGSEHITNFTYDNNDKSCKAISTEPNGDQYIYEYIRDKNGMWLLTKYVEYISTTNETKILAELTYDDNYKLIKENYQNSITTYTYNQKGNLIKKVDQTANGNTSTFDFTYDENDNLIRVISDKYIHEYTYDKNNNLIKIDITTIYDSGYEDKSTINYTYDNNGNVIKIDSNTDGIVTMDIEWKLFYIPHDNDNIESLLSSDYMYNMKPSW